MKEWILDRLGYRPGAVIEITPQLINEIFPHPRKATTEEMELLINSGLGLSNIVDRSEFADILRKSQKEQIDDFCNKNGLEYQFLSDKQIYLFRRIKIK